MNQKIFHRIASNHSSNDDSDESSLFQRKTEHRSARGCDAHVERVARPTSFSTPNDIESNVKLGRRRGYRSLSARRRARRGRICFHSRLCERSRGFETKGSREKEAKVRRDA